MGSVTKPKSISASLRNPLTGVADGLSGCLVGWMDGRVGGWVDEWMGGRLDDSMTDWMGRWMDGCRAAVGGLMDWCMEGRMVGWVDRGRVVG